MAHFERGVPSSQQRQIVLIQIGDGLGVVGLELRLRNLVDPRMHHLAQDLAARLAPHRLRDDPDRVLGLDEAE
jgi:hypothetical protein